VTDLNSGTTPSAVFALKKVELVNDATAFIAFEIVVATLWGVPLEATTACHGVKSNPLIPAPLKVITLVSAGVLSLPVQARAVMRPDSRAVITDYARRLWGGVAVDRVWTCCGRLTHH
jgi:hypothetical protein